MIGPSRSRFKPRILIQRQDSALVDSSAYEEGRGGGEEVKGSQE